MCRLGERVLGRIQIPLHFQNIEEINDPIGIFGLGNPQCALVFGDQRAQGIAPRLILGIGDQSAIDVLKRLQDRGLISVDCRQNLCLGRPLGSRPLPKARHI